MFKKIKKVIEHYQTTYTIYEDQSMRIKARHWGESVYLSNTKLNKMVELYLKYSIRELNRNLKLVIRNHILVADLHEKDKREVVEYVLNNFTSTKRLGDIIEDAVKKVAP